MATQIAQALAPCIVKQLSSQMKCILVCFGEVWSSLLVLQYFNIFCIHYHDIVVCCYLQNAIRA